MFLNACDVSRLYEMQILFWIFVRHNPCVKKNISTNDILRYVYIYWTIWSPKLAVSCFTFCILCHALSQVDTEYDLYSSYGLVSRSRVIANWGFEPCNNNKHDQRLCLTSCAFVLLLWSYEMLQLLDGWRVLLVLNSQTSLIGAEFLVLVSITIEQTWEIYILQFAYGVLFFRVLQICI